MTGTSVIRHTTLVIVLLLLLLLLAHGLFTLLSSCCHAFANNILVRSCSIFIHFGVVSVRCILCVLRQFNNLVLLPTVYHRIRLEWREMMQFIQLLTLEWYHGIL